MKMKETALLPQGKKLTPASKSAPFANLAPERREEMERVLEEMARTRQQAAATSGKNATL